MLTKFWVMAMLLYTILTTPSHSHRYEDFVSPTFAYEKPRQ